MQGPFLYYTRLQWWLVRLRPPIGGLSHTISQGMDVVVVGETSYLVECENHLRLLILLHEVFRMSYWPGYIDCAVTTRFLVSHERWLRRWRGKTLQMRFYIFLTQKWWNHAVLLYYLTRFFDIFRNSIVLFDRVLWWIPQFYRTL